jgi:TetR/AcrR family transcriptional repressor of lmrAB and yxaGH operons
MLRTAAELFRAQGYHATGLNQVLTEGGAPRGSLYFHFPGGKEQLAVESLTMAGCELGDALRAVLADAGDPARALDAAIELLGNHLRDSDFRAGCPISTVALDVAADSEPIRAVCSESYARWETAIADALVRHGVPRSRATALGTVALSAIEGALLLARTHRDLAPLHAVAAHLRETLSAALPRRSTED